ncbi:MAG: apolipoprotein N-acyltransferase, partial [Mariprofundaceae bacterium]
SLWISPDFPATAVLTELLRGHLFTGLPSTSLGNLILDTPAIGWAGVIGVYGAAFIPALIAMALATFTDRRMTSAAVITLALCVILIWLAPQPTEPESRERTVALIQGNIPQDVKWDRAFLNETMRRYSTLSTSTADDSDLIIWPEAAVPFFLSRAPGWDTWLKNRVTIWNQPLLFGGLKMTDEKETSDTPNAQNGLFLQMHGQGERSFTGKHHLVPFGEYVPSWLPWLGKLVPNIANFQAAENGGVLKSSDTVFGSLICYESIFPEEARSRVEQGAQVLVIVTNDAWYGQSPAAWQHLQASRMRAVETGRYVLRAANTGVSAIIAPDGSIKATAPWWTQAVVKGTYRLSDLVTPYQKWGDLPALIIAGLLLLAAGFRRKR